MESPEIFEKRVLREQAEIYCRCMHTILCRFGKERASLYQAGHKNSPPYWHAAQEFVDRNLLDPLRTEILWLESQVEWRPKMGAQGRMAQP